MHLEDSASGSSHLHWPMRPADVACMRQQFRLPNPPPTPPGGGTSERFVRRRFLREDVGVQCPIAEEERPDHRVDRKLKLGELFRLMTSLIDGQNERAAALLLDHLASSKLADSELSCTETVFKCQFATLIDKHMPEVSQSVCVVVKDCFSEESKLTSEVEDQRFPSPPPKTSRAVEAFARFRFRCLRSKRSQSMSGSRTITRSMVDGASSDDVINEDTRVPDGTVDLEDVEVSDWLRSTSYGQNGVDDTDANNQDFPFSEGNDNTHLEHGVFRNRRHSCIHEAADDAAACSRDLFRQEGAEDVCWKTRRPHGKNC